MGEISLDDAVEQLGFGKFQKYVLVILIIIVGGEAVEFFVISYTVPFVICEFKISNFVAAIISMVFFLCVMVGSYIWGYLMDQYGRHRCLLLSEFMIAYFGLLSAASPSLSWFIFLRGIVGIALPGTLGTAYTLFMELMPVSKRIFLNSFHGVAAGLTGCLLLLVGSGLIHRFGWRPIMLLASIPSIIGGLMTAIFVPRSPRFLLLNGRQEEAQKIFVKISKINGLPDFPWRVEGKFSSEFEKSAIALFSKDNLRLTIPVLLFSFATGFIHYGTVLLSIVMPSFYIGHCPSISNQNPSSLTDSSCQCETNSIFLPIFLGTAGEILAFIFPGPIAFFIGRRASLIIGGLLAVICYIFHIFCKSIVFLSISLMFNRTITCGLLLVGFLYTSEAFPTSVRGGALGVATSVNRFGNMMVPLLVQVYLPSFPLWHSMLGMMIVAASIVVSALLLPFETKDRYLYETFDESKTSSYVLDKSYETSQALWSHERGYQAKLK